MSKKRRGHPIFWRYCRDRVGSAAVYAAAAIMEAATMHAFGLNAAAVVFMTVLVLSAGAGILAAGGVRRARYYEEVFTLLDQMDKKYLLAEMLEEPSFLEGRLLYDVVCRTDKAMNDHIAAYRRRSEEYREYIETWVHEIKTPLASGRLIVANNDGDAIRSLGEELTRVEDFVEQALFYSRSNNVEKDYLVREVSLRETVNAVVRRHSRDFIEKKLQLRMEGLDRTVFTDAKWLEFILHQLVDNAVKYTGEQGCICFSAREEAEKVLLAVADSGVGIPAEDLPRVFDKGFTGANGRQSARSTGMGLYLSRKLCGKLGLTLSVSSRAGDGTTAEIVFPRGSLTLGLTDGG